jgi:hypothetical protein
MNLVFFKTDLFHFSLLPWLPRFLYEQLARSSNHTRTFLHGLHKYVHHYIICSSHKSCYKNYRHADNFQKDEEDGLCYLYSNPWNNTSNAHRVTAKKIHHYLHTIHLGSNRVVIEHSDHLGDIHLKAYLNTSGNISITNQRAFITDGKLQVMTLPRTIDETTAIASARDTTSIVPIQFLSEYLDGAVVSLMQKGKAEAHGLLVIDDDPLNLQKYVHLNEPVLETITENTDLNFPYTTIETTTVLTVIPTTCRLPAGYSIPGNLDITKEANILPETFGSEYDLL